MKGYSTPARILALATIVGMAEAAPMLEAIEFWRRHGGSAGVWWAVAMPAVALFLWFQLQAWQKWLVGGLASITLLAAPLWQVAAPVLEAQANAPALASAQQAQIRLLQDQIAEGIHKAEIYVSNSRARTGWLPAIQANDQALAAARTELGTLLQHPVTTENGWLSWAVAVIQALSLVLMHTASVIAIRHMEPLLETVAVTAKMPKKQQDNIGGNAQKTALETVQAVTVTELEPLRKQSAVDVIYERLVSGKYGTEPVGRRIRDLERVGYAIVQKALERAEENGLLVREGQGFKLVTEGAV